MDTSVRPLSRPWPHRLMDALQLVFERWAQQRARRATMERELRELAVVAELDPRMLRDVGAPPGLRHGPAEERERRRLERLLLGGDARHIGD